MYTRYISEKYYGKYCFIRTYAVFTARGASLNEHHINGGTEIQFMYNDLHYPGRAENLQREIIASDLPETNYKAVLILEILVAIISSAVFQIRIYLPAFCSETCKMSYVSANKQRLCLYTALTEWYF